MSNTFFDKTWGLREKDYEGLYKGEMMEITFHILDRDKKREDYVEYQKRKSLTELFEAVVDKWGINAIVRYKEHEPRRYLDSTLYGYSAIQLNIELDDE